MIPFASFRSWDEPGTVLEATAPVEMIAGGPEEWPRLRAWLARHREGSNENVAARAGAMGLIGYDGSFRFGWFPRIEAQAADRLSEGWRERSREAENGMTPDTVETAWTANQTQAEFEARVRRAQEYIAAGDIYQVNLAQRFTTSFAGNRYRLFEHLNEQSPAPGAAFLDFGDLAVLSASPELFLRIRGRQVNTRPIKGTRPRGTDAAEDARLAAELMADPKERAELVMITDLERNDLGRICDYGSVEVTQLAQLEKFAQVFHLVSTVEGRLRADIDALEAVRACLPGGSITGAPKRRAFEIIAELEPTPRGFYTGAIGWFDANGDATFSIAIRTLFLETGALHFSVGSGITAGSIPTREYEETLHKAAGPRQALDAYAGTTS